MRTTRRQRNVALLLPVGWETAEPIRRGVAAYAREHGPWSLTQPPEWWHGGPRELLHWHGDGALAELRTERDVRVADSVPYPVVNVLESRPPSVQPRIVTDSRTVGRLGAEHFLERGFTRCVFYGTARSYYVAERLAGFRARLDEAGVACRFLPAPSLRAPWTRSQSHRDRLDAFLRSLTPPVAVMGADDMRARLAIEACARIGLTVPDDVAVLGVDNMTVACEFCAPPLSSIDRNLEQLGYEMARLLDDRMAGRRVPAGDRTVPPLGVVPRRSTDVLAIEEPEVRRAVEYIQAHLASPFGIAELATDGAISRRWLEVRFRARLGITPHEYLCAARVKEAKRLLDSEPRMQLQDIAAYCGFTDARRLRLVFERITGQTPRAYRRSSRSRGGAGFPGQVGASARLQG